MPSFTDRRNTAGDRYAVALDELCTAYCELSALDQMCRAPSFGPEPCVIAMRHPTFAPNVAGSFTDGVPAAFAALSAGR